MIIRRSRGYVPEPIILEEFNTDPAKTVLACGAHLKNTFCLTKENQFYISHHIGDLDNLETLTAYEKGIEHFERILKIQPKIIAYDSHPEYLSSKYAKKLLSINHKLVSMPVQHHHAHIVSCIADNLFSCRKEKKIITKKLNDYKVIGVAFDGTGYGDDGNIWGSEFLISDLRNYQRAGHLKYIPMPGGELAIKEPWRMAVSWLYHIYGNEFMKLKIDFIKRIDKKNFLVLKTMINQKINWPLTLSMGRLFDTVASLVGIRDEINYEGQAAIELEQLVKNKKIKFGTYRYKISQENGIYIIDPSLIIMGIVEDLEKKVHISDIAGKFHQTVSEIVIDTIQKIYSDYSVNSKQNNKSDINSLLKGVALSGGVFQNMVLLDSVYHRLKEKGFNVYIHSQIPTNDGGISLGQAIIANVRCNIEKNL